jgi:hypothetical protein
MAAKYINIFQSKALQNLPKWGFLVRKQTIWQPWAGITRQNFAAVHDSKYEPSFLFKKKPFLPQNIQIVFLLAHLGLGT